MYVYFISLCYFILFLFYSGWVNYPSDLIILPPARIGRLRGAPGGLQEAPEASWRLREAPGGSGPGGLREAPGGLREALGGLQEAPGGLQEAPGGLQETPGGLREASGRPPGGSEGLRMHGKTSGRIINPPSVGGQRPLWNSPCHVADQLRHGDCEGGPGSIGQT